MIDLEAARKICEAATPGPNASWACKEDREFIAFARTALPTAIDELAMLREEKEYLFDKLESLRTESAELRKAKPWSFCPECGCEEIHDEEGAHKQCVNCHQDYWSDIDYTGVVQTNLGQALVISKAVTEQAKVIDKLRKRLELAESVCRESHIFLQDFLNKASCVPGALHRKIEAWRAAEEGK